MADSSVSAAEIARFGAMAAQWWDPNGPMRALHRMNPARIGWICTQAAAAFPGRPGLRLLDVGCGAGIAAEALARRGLDVLGIDASAELVEAARAHTRDGSLTLSYRVATAEQLVAERLSFPVVIALEVVEHVAEPIEFVRTLTRLLEPQGLLVLSTLNRTVRSYLAAKVAAEFVLRWLPPGTHDWRRFLTPAELSAVLRQTGQRVTASCGLSIDPLRGSWGVSRDSSVNYMIASRAG